MHFAKHWAKGKAEAGCGDGRGLVLECWRWSDNSAAEAAQLAAQAAKALAERFAAGGRLDHYGYTDRPVREEVVETFSHKGKTIAAITRNSYGALVLNTEGAMFLDVDIPEQSFSEGAGAFFKKLMGKPAGQTREQAALSRLREWAASRNGWGLRIYRTKGGLRGLVTHDTFDPASPETRSLLESAGVDPLYIKLCRSQCSFRARLTPKPWRIGESKPPSRFPYPDEVAQRAFRQWEEEYREASSGYSACEILETVGPTWPCDAVARITEIHDRYACTARSKGLA